MHTSQHTLRFIPAPALGADAFKSAFTAAQEWGSYQRSKQGRKTTEAITLKRGTLRLRKFACALPGGTLPWLADIQDTRS